MDEVTRTLIGKWGMPGEKAKRREAELLRHFPEAWVEGFEPLIPVMSNQVNDRHVLAAAVYSRCDLIVTYNRRDFPPAALEPWGIEVQGPSTFLRGLYDLAPDLFVEKLHQQAAAIQVPLPRLLRSLEKNVPRFIQYFCQQQGIDLGQGPQSRP